MRSRTFQLVALLVGVGILVGFALLGQAAPVSTYSTFDTGANGYEALYNVLRREGLDVTRLQSPLELRDARVRVIAFTSTLPERRSGEYFVYDDNDYKRLAAFQKHGGTLIYFASPASDPMQKDIKKKKLPVTFLDATKFTNLALSKKPEAMRIAYDALAGRGRIAFDERLHGYAVDRTMWSILSWPVRFSVWIVVLAMLIMLVDANIRYAPPIEREPPLDRDSAAYIASMAALLRRARAPHSPYRKEAT